MVSSVDVVIPCYNYARFLSRCVDSVLQQQGVDVRVLIIDDASSDDTPGLRRDWHWIRESNFGGMSATAAYRHL